MLITVRSSTPLSWATPITPSRPPTPQLGARVRNGCDGAALEYAHQYLHDEVASSFPKDIVSLRERHRIPEVLS